MAPFFTIIIYTFISLISLILIHNIILFLFDTLTIPKSKNMVQIANKNYENIYKIVSKIDSAHDTDTEITPINSLPNININNNENNITINNNDSEIMKNELTNYLRNEIY